MTHTDTLLEQLAAVTNAASMTVETCGQCGQLVIVWRFGVCEVREHICQESERE